MLRYIVGGDVLEAARRRIRWLFEEFEGKVAVSMSGGKDSTVLFHLARDIADEYGIGRLPVLWLDQELEYAATADYMRSIMYRDDVEPYWLQVPFRLANNTSHDPEHQWLHVWGDGEEWIRERDPIAITENVYGSDRFKSLLNNATGHHFPGWAMLLGIRVEESPSRLLGMTSYPAYKWITWGTQYKTHTNFAPIYDWGFRDIWKVIHDEGWPYNPHYDAQYRMGIGVRDMRVSNFHHEQSARNLFTLQEIEPDTWARATARLAGISTAGSLGTDDYMVYELPFMFTTWEAYRDHLLETLIAPEQREAYRAKFRDMERMMPVTMNDPKWGRLNMVKQQCRALIANDYEFVQLTVAVLCRPRALREADLAHRRAAKAAAKEKKAATA